MDRLISIFKTTITKTKWLMLKTEVNPRRNRPRQPLTVSILQGQVHPLGFIKVFKESFHH